MKGLLVITLSIALSSTALHAEEAIPTPSKVADEAISSSMIGWGIALAIGITVLAIVLGSNDNSHAHTDS
ncbi:MAG: hypothetical protein ChlgKO_07370 [Chlamydiales bacterium]